MLNPEPQICMVQYLDLVLEEVDLTDQLHSDTHLAQNWAERDKFASLRDRRNIFHLE